MAEVVGPGLLRVVAPNPSPMTERGTNSYLLGERALAVIDPGPDDPRHLAALLAAIAGRPVRHILVTHAHRDHSALAPALAAATGAPVLAFGTATEGRSAAMRALAAAGFPETGGSDPAFVPDRRLADGEILEVPGMRLEALHTPGHMGSHLCFLGEGFAITGDLAMGWASTVISPPDGDLADFRASCRRLLARAPGRLLPGHGAPVEDGVARLRWLLAHRDAREAQIRDALAQGPATAATLARALYADAPPAVLPAAERNVLAHLLDLATRGLARPEPAPSPTALWHPLP